jgi:phenylalanyl-tRNA synthetase beta chain
LVAAGFFEAMTPSAVGEELSSVFSPWTDAAPIRCSTPMLRGADCLRRSLIPSLLAARRINESFANPRIELFETAHVYLPRANQLPQEELLLAITTGGDFRQLKGVLEAILAAVGSQVELELDTRNSAGDLLHPQESCSLILDGKLLGYLGTVSATGLERLQLRAPTCVAQLRMGLLQEIAQLIPQYRVLSPFPAITYDLNLVVPETARWSDLLSTVRAAAGPTLEDVRYRDTYRDPRKDGPGRHRLFFSIVLRSSDSTMTNQDADGIRDQIVAACESRHGALLLS